jgi:predicted nucleotidyltransferase
MSVLTWREWRLKKSRKNDNERIEPCIRIQDFSLLPAWVEDTFGTKIDLVTNGGLRSDMRDKVMQDLVLV